MTEIKTFHPVDTLVSSAKINKERWHMPCSSHVMRRYKTKNHQVFTPISPKINIKRNTYISCFHPLLCCRQLIRRYLKKNRKVGTPVSTKINRKLYTCHAPVIDTSVSKAKPSSLYNGYHERLTENYTQNILQAVDAT